MLITFFKNIFQFCVSGIFKISITYIPLEGMMLKLKLQYFGHLVPRVHSLEKTLMLGGIGGRRRRGRQRMRWLDGITDSMDVTEWTLGVGDGQGGLACCDSWGRKESDTTERLNWTEQCLYRHWSPWFTIWVTLIWRVEINQNYQDHPLYTESLSHRDPTLCSSDRHKQ